MRLGAFAPRVALRSTRGYSPSPLRGGIWVRGCRFFASTFATFAPSRLICFLCVWAALRSYSSFVGGILSPLAGLWTWSFASPQLALWALFWRRSAEGGGERLLRVWWRTGFSG